MRPRMPLAEVAERAVVVDRHHRHDIRAGRRIAQAGRVVGREAVAGRDGDENAVGLELGEFVFQRRPVRERVVAFHDVPSDRFTAVIGFSNALRFWWTHCSAFSTQLK